MGAASGIVLGVTLVVYVISFGLALGAISRRSKATQVIDTQTGLYTCEYTSDVATGLAAGAFIFLVIAQTMIMVVTRCLCCGRDSKPGAARTFAVVVFILSWLSFVIAAAALIAGAAQNKIHWYYIDGTTITCREVRKSVFAAGAAFTFLTMIWSEIYYVLISKARDGEPWAANSYPGAPGQGAYP